MRHAAAPLRAGAALENEAKLVAPVYGQPPGRVHVPRLTVDRQGATGHTLTSLQSSHASGAYVPIHCNRFSSLLASGSRDAWARCDISVGLSENSMNNRGSLALRNSQIRCPRASANWLSSRSVFTYSVSCWAGTRTRAAVKTFGIFTPLPQGTPAAVS